MCVKKKKRNFTVNANCKRHLIDYYDCYCICSHQSKIYIWKICDIQLMIERREREKKERKREREKEGKKESKRMSACVRMYVSVRRMSSHAACERARVCLE